MDRFSKFKNTLKPLIMPKKFSTLHSGRPFEAGAQGKCPMCLHYRLALRKIMLLLEIWKITQSFSLSDKISKSISQIIFLLIATPPRGCFKKKKALISNKFKSKGDFDTNIEINATMKLSNNENEYRLRDHLF